MIKDITYKRPAKDRREVYLKQELVGELHLRRPEWSRRDYWFPSARLRNEFHLSEEKYWALLADARKELGLWEE